MQWTLASAWLMWSWAALFYAYEFFQRVAPALIALPLMKTMHLSPEVFAWISSLYLYAYALAQIPAGLILDRFGSRICLSLAALSVALGTLLFASVHMLSLLALGRILVGIGSAFAFVGCLKIASAAFEEKTFPVVVGLTNLLGVVGALFGEAPLSALIHQVGWEESLKISSLLGLVLSIGLWIFLKPAQKKSPHSEKFFSRVQILFCSPQAWWIGCYAGLMVSPVIAFTELWSIPFLEKFDQLSALRAAFVNQFIFIGIAIGGPIHGWISGKISARKPVMGLGQLMALFSLSAILALHLPTWTLIGLMFVFGFSVSSMLLAFSLSTETHPKFLSGTAIAFTNLCIMLIGAGFQNAIGFGLTHFFKNEPNLPLLILPFALALNFLIWRKLPEKP